MYGDVSLLTPLMAGGGKGTPWHPGGDVSTDTASPVGEHPCCCGASGWVCKYLGGVVVSGGVRIYEVLYSINNSMKG